MFIRIDDNMIRGQNVGIPNRIYAALTCLEYIRILSNSLRSAKAATTFGVALALIYIFKARSLSTVYITDKTKM